MMKLAYVSVHDLHVEADLVRTSRKRVFEDHLAHSIDEIGLDEPLKVAKDPQGRLVVLDGIMRLEAIRALRESDPSRFIRIPVYMFPYEQRYEIRFQTDIYQDLLPSQLAALVEHLHAEGHVSKKEIARSIGISAATLRNYTGLWRLVQRGGLFAGIVELMDRGIMPSSNPYAWLRLTADGIRSVIENHFSGGATAEESIAELVDRHAGGGISRFTISEVDHATGSLPNEFYRETGGMRDVKRALGSRKGKVRTSHSFKLRKEAREHLQHVQLKSRSRVLVAAAASLARSIA